MQAEGSQTQLPTRQFSPLWGLPLPREKRPALPRYATYLFCCISRCHRASPGTPQTPGHLPPGPGCPQWLRRARHPPARMSPGSCGNRGEGRFSSGPPSSTSYLEAAPQPPSSQEWAGQELLEEGGAQRSRQGRGGAPRMARLQRFPQGLGKQAALLARSVPESFSDSAPPSVSNYY